MLHGWNNNGIHFSKKHTHTQLIFPHKIKKMVELKEIEDSVELKFLPALPHVQSIIEYVSFIIRYIKN